MRSQSTLIEDLPALTIRRISVSSMENNVYALTAKKSGVQLIIDAADDAAAIREMLKEACADTPCDVALQAVVTTHSHWDHVRALADLATDENIEVAAGAEDAAEITTQTDVEVSTALQHLDTVNFDGVSLDVIALRGHTPGSVALVYPVEDGPTHIFSGDSLFPGGVGKTQNAEDFTQLLADVTARIFDVYDDDTIIHPGHGEPTTLGAERSSLDAWRERGW